MDPLFAFPPFPPALLGEAASLGASRVLLDALLLLAGAALGLAGRALGRRPGRQDLDREAQARIREAEGLFHLLVDNVKDFAIFMLDPQGRVMTWNPGAERIKGYRAEEILGQSFACFFTPADRAEDLPGQILRTVEVQGRAEVEGWRVRKDGSRFMAQVVLTAVREEDGRLRGFAKVTRDITEARAAEEKLRAFSHDLETLVADKSRALHESEAKLQGFIRHAPAAIAFKGLDGRYLLVNPRMEAVLGRNQGEVLDRTDQELFPAEIAEVLLRYDRKVIQARAPLEAEEQWPHPDGSFRDFLAIKFPLLDDSGWCWGLGTISTDITERKRAEQALLQSQKLESMGILAGGIAHDFNNLLGAILGNVGLIQMEIPPGSDVHQHLRNLEGLVLKATYLTRQMLAYSGRGKFQVKSLNLNRMVEEMTHLLRISISKKAVIRFDIFPDLPSIEADASQMQQVVMNLVINASDALGVHSGVISIRTGVEHLDVAQAAAEYGAQDLVPGLYVFLEVADDGMGMSPETRQRIFDPFFTTKFTGRGLGLAAVHGIVRGHHGGIRVYSEVGKGTSFKLLFPATSMTVEAVLPEAVVEGYRGSGLVLVVDDEESIRSMAVAVLTRLGFEVLEAVDGLEALEKVERHGPVLRLILMDLTMPRLDGEETYRELRQRGVRIPVILSSGFSEMEAVNRFLGKGLAGFLQKPYKYGTLVQMVREALEGPAPLEAEGLRDGEDRPSPRPS